MEQPKEKRKVFISYSWMPEENQDKVILLAQRLSNQNIHVIIDVYDLKPGQDKYLFMEQMVNNPDVNKVLLICNKEYVRKANERKGGVGNESMIISPELYTDANQTKFIPVIFEYEENGKPCIPAFIHSRIYIDLSNEEIYEKNYIDLVRNIYDKPLYQRPPLGATPAYVLDDEPIYLPTAHIIPALKKALIEERKIAKIHLEEYFETFITALDQFQIKDDEVTNDNFIELVAKRINDLKILRTDFISFITTYISYSVEIDVERLHSFFEKLLDYQFGYDLYPTYNSLGSLKYDQYRFFYYDLFLHFVQIMIEKGRYQEMGFILHHSFVIHIPERRDAEVHSFISFNRPVPTLNQWKKNKYNLGRISVVADQLYENEGDDKKFRKLQQFDALLYYISLFPVDYGQRRHFWMPETTAYDFYSLPIMEKAVSKKYLNKILPLFNVISKDELVKAVDNIIAAGIDSLQRFNYNIPDIKYGLNIDKLSSII
ncbi:MAG: hypothetical protein JWQ09_4594 [Segetibacter sp.]|nr:hypothetical protein [Segetibacter sp.]